VLEVHEFPRGRIHRPRTGAGARGVDAKSRAEVMQMTDIFRAKIVDVQPKSLTIEITGNESKVEKFLA
jgi:acetolactate synthase small subunit